MTWTELHARLLSKAFEKLLGRADAGTMAFVRCLTPDVIEALAEAESFAPGPWRVWRVADAGAQERERLPQIARSRCVKRRQTLYCCW